MHELQGVQKPLKLCAKCVLSMNFLKKRDFKAFVMEVKIPKSQEPQNLCFGQHRVILHDMNWVNHVEP